jgi:hypothetical protein
MNNPFGNKNDLEITMPLPPHNNSMVFNLPLRTDDEKSIQTDKIKLEIYDNIIYPYIKNELEILLRNSKRWNKANLILVICKYICLVAVPILSLSAPYFVLHTAQLAFSSGVLASLGLGFERLSKLAQNISKNHKEKFNTLLQQINIKSYQLKDVDLKTEAQTNEFENIQTPKRK